MLKLKLQYFVHLKSQLIGKDPDAGKDWGQEKGTTEDEMVGWHHRLNGHEFEHTPAGGEEQGSLVCWCPWSPKDLVTTEQQMADSCGGMAETTQYCKAIILQLKIKANTQKTSLEEDVEKLEPWRTVGGSVKWCSHCWKYIQPLKK